MEHNGKETLRYSRANHMKFVVIKSKIKRIIQIICVLFSIKQITGCLKHLEVIEIPLGDKQWQVNVETIIGYTSIVGTGFSLVCYRLITMFIIFCVYLLCAFVHQLGMVCFLIIQLSYFFNNLSYNYSK